MINNYTIKNDTLYLYLNYDFEFSSELGIKNRINEYIKNMKIKFTGTKIVLVVAGIAVATYFYNPKVIDNNKYVSSTLLPGYHIVEQVNEDLVANIEEVIQSTTNEIKEENNKIIQEEISNEEIVQEKEIIQDNLNQEEIVTVYRNNGSILELNMTDYLIGVLGAEMPASFNIEALKAGAIVSRTYALKK